MIFWLVRDYAYYGGPHKAVLPNNVTVVLFCVNTPCDVCTVIESPSDAFLGTYC